MQDRESSTGSSTPTIEIVEEPDHVRVVIRGVADREVLSTAHHRISKDGTFTRRRRLWDLREAELDLASEDLKALAHEANRMDAEAARVALVVSDDVTYGIGRVQQARREEFGTRLGVFRELDEAVAFLRAAPGDDD